MIARLGVLLLLLVAGCSDGVRANGDSDRVRVRGTVLRAADLEPVEGAIISGPGKVQTRSGPDGRFLLKSIPRGSSGELRAEWKVENGVLTAKLPLRSLLDDEIEVVLHLRQP